LQELPKKFEKIVYCSFTPSQKDSYLALLKESQSQYKNITTTIVTSEVSSKEKYQALATSDPVTSSRNIDKIPNNSSVKKALSNALMQLRKMANHPLHFRQHYTDDKLRIMSKLIRKVTNDKLYICLILFFLFNLYVCSTYAYLFCCRRGGFPFFGFDN